MLTVKYTTPNGEEIIAPGLDEVFDSLVSIEDWGIGELWGEENGAFHSQLILIIERSYGVIICFCPENGENEYIYIDRKLEKVSSEIVTTFDGGDDWDVPIFYFNDFNACRKIISYFLSTGQRTSSNQWEVLGANGY